MRNFEKKYRLREGDDVLTRLNGILQDLDLRADAIELIAEAFKTGNRLDVDALLANINADFAEKSADFQAVLDEVAAGFTPDRILETVQKRFTSDAEMASKATPADIADAIAPLAPLDSPQFTNTPRAPTAAPGTNTTQIATTAFVIAAVQALLGGAPDALNTLKELADALASDGSFAGTVTTSLANRVRLDAAGNYNTGQMQQARANILAPSVEAAAAMGLVFDPFMEISQESGTALVTTTGGVDAYSADVLSSINTAASVGMTVQNIPNPAGGVDVFKRLTGSVKATITTGKSILSAGEVIRPGLVRVEGHDFDGLGWGTNAARNLDLVAVVMTNWSGTLAISIRNPSASRSLVTTVPVTANVPTPVLFSIPADQAGAWGPFGAAAAISVGLGMVTGSATHAPTLNAWSDGNYSSHASATNWAATAGNFVQIAYLNVFPKGVLPWTSASQLTGEALHRLLSMRRPYAERMRTAQRYWEKSYDYAARPGVYSTNGIEEFGFMPSPTFVLCNVRFQERKRTSSPSVMVYTIDGVPNAVGVKTSPVGPESALAPGGLYGIGDKGFMIFQPSAGSVSFHWVASSRL